MESRLIIGDNMDNNIIDVEKDFEISTLHNEITRLKNEISKYRILLNEVDNEANPNFISDEEIICVEQIRKLKEDSATRVLSTDEAKKLDIFHKNLKLARGEGTRVGSKASTKKMSSLDLEQIARK